MATYRLNPLEDPRWDALVAQHPSASVFHTTGWLRALHATYRYAPVVFTTSGPDQELQNGIVLCEVRSWLTGKRLVSLPFSDHCDPLVDEMEHLSELCSALEHERRNGNWNYVELRPRHGVAVQAGQFEASEEYWLHVLDLRRPAEELFRALHRDSIQRKIERAAREQLTCEEGTDGRTLAAFYRLLVQTRRRHGVPPQPFSWFRRLAEHMAGEMTVRIASQHGRPVAGILTLRHRQTVVYKYGASDASWHKTGCMPFLFWRTIEASRETGNVALDLGRTSRSNQGLLTFKNRLGAVPSIVTYRRHQAAGLKSGSMRTWITRYGAEALRRVPPSLGAAAGRLLYRHVA